MSVINIFRRFDGDNDVDDLIRRISPTKEDFLARFEPVHLTKNILNTKDGVYIPIIEVSIPDSIKSKISEIKILQTFEVADQSRKTFITGLKEARNEPEEICTDIANFTLTCVKVSTSNRWIVNKMVKVTEVTLTIQKSADIFAELTMSTDDFASSSKLRAALTAIPMLRYCNSELHFLRQAAMSSPNIFQEDSDMTLGWNHNFTEYTQSNAGITMNPLSVKFKSGYRPGSLNSEKKSIAKISKEETKDLFHTLFNSIIYMHDPVTVLVAFSVVAIGWFRNRLFPIFHKRPIFEFIGLTASGKTMVVRVAISMDGDPFAHNSFTSTINALMRDMLLLKDMMLMVDDHKPELTDPNVAKHLASFTQASFDGKSRDRMNETGATEVNSGLIFTGEVSTRTMSSIGGRVFTIQVDPYLEIEGTTVHFNKASECMSKISGLKPELLKYFHDNFDTIVSEIRDAESSYRSKLPVDSNSDRLVYAAAELHCFSKRLIEFAVENEYMTSDISSNLIEKIRAFIFASTKSHINDVQSLSLAHIYVQTVLELVLSGRCKIKNFGKYESDIFRDTIGYCEGDWIYMYPEVSVKVVASTYSDKSLSMTVPGIRKSLIELKMIPSSSMRKRIEGNQLVVWMFNKNTFSNG